MDTLQSIDNQISKTQNSPQEQFPISFNSIQIGHILACFVYCEVHLNMVICRYKDKGDWLPMKQLVGSESWIDACQEILGKIFGNNFNNLKINEISRPELVHMYRIQIPETSEFCKKTLFKISIRSPSSCCTNTQYYDWKPLFFINTINKLWGPEPMFMVEHLKGQDPFDNLVEELDTNDVSFHLSGDKLSSEELLLKSALFKEKDIIVLLNDYIRHCIPSQFMSIYSFSQYIKKIGWNINDQQTANLFRAFNYNFTNYLTFYELLYGLAAMDHATNHGGITGELRLSYIFRYYDLDADGFLTLDDLCNMQSDIFKSKNVKKSPEEIRIIALDLIDKISSSSNKISFEDFIKSVSTMTFRGTSTLFRSQVNSIMHISAKILPSKIQYTNTTAGLVAKRHYDDACVKCRSIRYKVSQHSIKIDLVGNWIENKSLADTAEGRNISFINNIPKTEAVLNAELILDHLRQIDAIMNQRYGPAPKDFDAHKLRLWFFPDKKTQLEHIKKLLDQAELVMAEEDRLLKVGSPCFIFGDIHGNLKDLLTYEKNLWRSGPYCLSSKYLFLGDYIDRGEFGVECVCYLLCMKIIAPKHFFICRGNHEVRELQKQFTYYNECLNRFDEDVWELSNKVFDRLPICAIIDDALFCAHGGIPASSFKLEKLNQIPTPLYNPELDSNEAWEILWNDPMNIHEFKDLIAFNKLQPDQTGGFMPNTKRGTAYFYSDQAVNAFFQANRLSYVIRGHEVVMPGYAFHMKGRVITIFSSSSYCNLKNESACLFVDQEKLRIISIET